MSIRLRIPVSFFFFFGSLFLIGCHLEVTFRPKRVSSDSRKQLQFHATQLFISPSPQRVSKARWSFPCACVHAQSLQLCSTHCDPWTVAHQAPLSMGFSRQEYWSGLPCPPPGKNTRMDCHALLQGIFLISRIKPMSPASPALAGRFFYPLSHLASPEPYIMLCNHENDIHHLCYVLLVRSKSWIPATLKGRGLYKDGNTKSRRLWWWGWLFGLSLPQELIAVPTSKD